MAAQRGLLRRGAGLFAGAGGASDAAGSRNLSTRARATTPLKVVQKLLLRLCSGFYAFGGRR
jgi:hypothetical protein